MVRPLWSSRTLVTNYVFMVGSKARPRVFVLTDGSGRSGVSRLSSTSEILADAGASIGSIYGRFTDQNLYAAILGGDFGLFEQIVAELAEALVRKTSRTSRVMR